MNFQVKFITRISVWLLFCTFIGVNGCSPGNQGLEELNNPIILKIGDKSFDLSQFEYFRNKNYSLMENDEDPDSQSKFFDEFTRECIISEYSFLLGHRITDDMMNEFLNENMPGVTIGLMSEAEREKFLGEIMRRMAVRDFLKNEILQDITISHNEIAEYYQEHQAKYNRKALFRFRHVQTKLKEEAVAFRNELRKSKEPFIQIAAKYSINEGYLIAPPMELESLPDPFKKALKKMRASQFSSVIPIKYGETTNYHVLYLESVIPATSFKLEEAQDDIIKTLETQKANALLEKKLEHFRTRIPTTIFSDKLPFRYNTPEQRGDKK